jgi:hypothetical protein
MHTQLKAWCKHIHTRTWKVSFFLGSVYYLGFVVTYLHAGTSDQLPMQVERKDPHSNTVHSHKNPLWICQDQTLHCCTAIPPELSNNCISTCLCMFVCASPASHKKKLLSIHVGCGCLWYKKQ